MRFQAVKKKISIALAFIIVIGILPMAQIAELDLSSWFIKADAAVDIVAQGSCGVEGTDVSYTLTSDGTLTVTGTGDMDYYTYMASGNSVFYNSIPWKDKIVSRVVISEGVTSVGKNTFRKQTRTNVISAELPSTLVSINANAFYQNKNLTRIAIPDSVLTIADSAFSETGLIEVKLPAAMETLGAKAFKNCISLKTVVLPYSLNSIGQDAFSGCESITDVYCGKTEEEWAEMTIGEGNEALTSANLHFCEHSFTDYSSNNDSTCTEDGTKTAFCDGGCGKTHTTVDEGSRTGHFPGEAVRENELPATCLTDGSFDEVIYCTVCDAEISREAKTVKAAGHIYDEGVITIQPTCVSTGEITFSCLNCNETRTEEAPIDPEHHVNVKTETTEPTCSSTGEVRMVCSDCGSLITSNELSTVDHNYVDYRVIEEPDEENDGSAVGRCSFCGIENTIALNYLQKYYWKVRFDVVSSSSTTLAHDETTVQVVSDLGVTDEFTISKNALDVSGAKPEFTGCIYGTPKLVRLSNIESKNRFATSKIHVEFYYSLDNENWYWYGGNEKGNRDDYQTIGKTGSENDRFSDLVWNCEHSFSDYTVARDPEDRKPGLAWGTCAACGIKTAKEFNPETKKYWKIKFVIPDQYDLTHEETTVQILTDSGIAGEFTMPKNELGVDNATAEYSGVIYGNPTRVKLSNIVSKNIIFDAHVHIEFFISDDGDKWEWVGGNAEDDLEDYQMPGILSGKALEDIVWETQSGIWYSLYSNEVCQSIEEATGTDWMSAGVPGYYMNTKTGVMIIRGKGPMPEFKTKVDINGTEHGIGISTSFFVGLNAMRPYHLLRNYIKKIIIEDGIENISESAFEDFKNLREVVIPESVMLIEESAFEDCPKLKYVRLPSSLVGMEENAFKNCTSLEAAYFPESFAEVHNKVEKINTSLETVEEIDLMSSDLKMISEEAFRGCENLRHINIPENATGIGTYAFEKCTGLTELSITGSSLKVIDNYAFKNCTNLRSITLNEGLETLRFGVFSNCSSLPSVYFPSTVKDIYMQYTSGEMTWSDFLAGIYGKEPFSNCRSLQSINVAPGNKKYASRDGVLYNADCTTLILYPQFNSRKVFSVPESVSTIRLDAFYKAKNLNYVYLPEGLETIEKWAFACCSNLKTIDIPNTVSVISSAAFLNCSSLETVTIPDSVTEIGSSAFSGCTLLDNVVIPSSITTIESSTFSSCGSLKRISIPDSVTSIGRSVFENCISLETVDVPDSVTSIGDSAFSGCQSLRTFRVPDRVTSIGSNTFSECKSLRTFNVPDSVTELGSRAFQKCEQLSEIHFGSNVTDIGYQLLNSTKYYDDPANWYNGCLYCNNCLLESKTDEVPSVLSIPFGTRLVAGSALTGAECTDVILPNTLKHINAGAFNTCQNLKTVVFNGNAEVVKVRAFARCKALRDVYYADKEPAEISFRSDDSNKEDDTYYSSASKHYRCGLVPAKDGSLVSWSFDSGTKELKLNQCAGKSISDMEAGEAPWIAYASSVRTLKFIETPGEIGRANFARMSSIADIEIGENISVIGKDAFNNCSGLSNVIYDGTASNWNRVYIANGNYYVNCARIVCKAEYIPERHVNLHEEIALRDDEFVSAHLEHIEEVCGFISKYSFHNNSSIDGSKVAWCKAWDTVEDLKKITEFKVSGYSLMTNYYEIYLNSLLSSFTDVISTEAERKAVEETKFVKYAKQYKSWYSSFKQAYGKTETWLNEDGNRFEKEIEKMFTVKGYNPSTEARRFINKLIKQEDGKTYTFFGQVLSSFSSVSGTINDIVSCATNAQDSVNEIFDVMDSVRLALAYQNVVTEFYDVLNAAANRIGDQEIAVGFRNAISKARRSTQSTMGIVLGIALDKVKEYSEKKISSFIKDIVVESGKNYLEKYYPGLPGNIALIIWGFQTGVNLANKWFSIGDLTNSYEQISSIAPIESALSSVAIENMNNFAASLTYSSAYKYDVSVRILSLTNAFLYSCGKKFLESDKVWGAFHEEEITRQNNMCDAYMSLWSKVDCHGGIDFGTKYSIKCPVDVYIYDSRGVLVTSIVNEQIEEWDSRIFVSVYDGEKTVFLPTDQQYRIEIVAREEGTMSFSAEEYTPDGAGKTVETNDIPLTVQQSFECEPDTEDDEPDFTLSTNEETITPDYDSDAVCAGEHTFSDWTEEQGGRTRTCSACGYKEFEAVHSEHADTIEVFETAPTCESPGHSVFVCSYCFDTVEDGNDYPALGHDIVQRETEPTCTESGTITNVCSACGFVESTEAGRAPEGHQLLDETAVTVEPTCLNEGLISKQCAVCGERFVTETIGKADHEIEIVPGVEATCSAPGYTDSKICSFCLEVIEESEEIPAAEHEPAVDGGVPATCTEAGESEYTYCVNCGAILQQSVPIPPSHTPGETVVENETPATCANEGSYSEVTYCSVCGEEISREIKSTEKLPHDYKGEVTPPTCTERGYTTYTCSGCGASYIGDETDELGHDFDAWIDNDANHIRSCSRPGCGFTETAEHSWGDGVVTRAPSCTEEGEKTFTCTVCGGTKTEPTEKLSHTPAEAVRENEIPSTCRNEGSYDSVVYCANCSVELSRETVPVDKLDHVPSQAVSENIVAATCTNEGSYSEVTYCSVCGEEISREAVAVDTLSHTPVTIPGKEETCTSTGLTEGSKCEVCGTIITAQTTIAKKAHSYTDKITKATVSKDGKRVRSCSVCGYKKSESKIAKASGITISKSKFVFDGKIRKPSVTVRDSAGKALAKSNYTIAYSNAKSKAVGTYKVTVKLKGSYTGSKALKYTIVPAKVSGLKAAKTEMKAIKLTWSKISGAKYYEVYGSNDGGKTFKKLGTVSTNSLNVKKVAGKALAAGKSYRFKVRALDSTKKLAGAFSTVLKTGTLTAAPKITKISSSKSKTAALTWGKVSGAKSYTVYSSTDGKKFTVVKSRITKTGVTVTGLRGGKKIYLKLVAVNAYGKNSAYSTVKSITVKK